MKDNIFCLQLLFHGNENFKKDLTYKTPNIINWVDALHENEPQWVCVFLNVQCDLYLMYMKKEDFGIPLIPHKLYHSSTQSKKHRSYMSTRLQDAVKERVIALNDNTFNEEDIKIVAVTSFSLYALQLYLCMYADYELMRFLILPAIIDWAHYLLFLNVYTLKQYMIDIHKYELYDYIWYVLEYTIGMPFRNTNLWYNGSSNYIIDPQYETNDKDILQFTRKIDSSVYDAKDKHIFYKYIASLKIALTEVN